MLKKLVFLFLVLLLALGIGFHHVLMKNMQAPLKLKQAEILSIKSGTSFYAFSKLIVEKGWITERFWLRSYVRFNPELAKLKAGSYLIKPDTSLLALLQQLVTGAEHQFQITFIEGSTFKEWLNKLAEHPYIDHTLSDLSVAKIAQRLGIKHENPEGLFFPDTYAFTYQTSDVSILQRAYQRMSETLAKAWQNRQANLPYKDAYQALIMASIIEKESGFHAEQALIASVFVNRLNKNMRLQTDPTVIYGVGERYQGDITYQHLRDKNAYNTYQIKGLPPTPIAMPGIKAIEAAMQPAKSNYLYFVSNGDGKHIFSTNLQEHNKAVRKYVLKK